MGGKIKKTRVGVPCGLGPDAKEHNGRTSREKEPLTTGGASLGMQPEAPGSPRPHPRPAICHREISGLQEAGSKSRSSSHCRYLVERRVERRAERRAESPASTIPIHNSQWPIRVSSGHAVFVCTRRRAFFQDQLSRITRPDSS